MGPGPIRVAVTIGPAGHGGIATYSRELVRALAARDDVTVTTVGSEAALRQLGVQPADHLHTPSDRTREQLRVASLRRRLDRCRIDLVHVTRHVVPVGAGRPYVVTFHDDFALTRRRDYDLLKRFLLPPVYRRSLRRAAAVVTLHAETAALAHRYVGRGVPVVETGAGVPTDLSDAVPTAPATPLPGRYALVVGDAGPRKNLAALLDAWPTVERSTGLALVVAGGSAASPELLRVLRDGTVATFVEGPDWPELAHLYARSTLVVDSSQMEGFGFPRVEAAHFGRAVATVRSHASVLDAVEAALGSTSATADPQLPVPTWATVAERTVEVYRGVLRQEHHR